MNRALYRRLRAIERADKHRHALAVRSAAYAESFRAALAKIRPPVRCCPRPDPSPWAHFLARQLIRRSQVLSQINWRNKRAEVVAEIVAAPIPEAFRDICLAFAAGPIPKPNIWRISA